MVITRSGTRTKSEELNDEEFQDNISNGKHQINGNARMATDEKSVASGMHRVTFISLLLDLLGFTVILPLFPALLDYYSKNDSSGLYAYLLGWVTYYQDLLGVPHQFNSVLFGGLLGSLFSFLQFLSSPITGALSDVYGRKPIVIATLIGIAASYGMWAVASNFLMFVMARVIGGISKGNVSLSYSIMADIFDQKSRSKGMALIGIAFSIGFIIGPVIGAMFSRQGSSGWFASSALFALTLALLNIAYFTIFFKETLPKSKRRVSLSGGLLQAWEFTNPISLFSFRPLKSLEKKERSQLMTLGFCYFTYLFLYSGLEFTLTFVTHHKHNYSSMDQGKMFLYLGIIMSLMQGGYVRRTKDGQEKPMSIKGIIMMIPGFLLVGLSSTWIGLYSGLTLYAMGSSMMVPCLTALASLHGTDSEKGTLLGIWRSLGALARVVGPVVASIGFWCVGSEWCYALGGIMMVVPLFILTNY
ncbi:unnamed protein product, partial [Meganyctiphanes norvegica]